jgi:hypothetical protein
MHLQFVDNSNIDAQTRTKIRSQVMQGKNRGRKKRIKQERRKLAILTAKPLESTEESDDDLTMQNGNIVEWAIAKAATFRIWDDYSTYQYPHSLDWEMRRALHFCQFSVPRFLWLYPDASPVMLAATDIMYPKELCYDIQCPISSFFDLFQTNEAFFHCFVGISEGMRCIVMNQPCHTELGLRSLANTYRCINKELEMTKDPSMGTVASVMSLVMHENLFGMVGKSKLHLQALERMVIMKGGLGAFESNMSLLHKICRLVALHASLTWTTDIWAQI